MRKTLLAFVLCLLCFTRLQAQTFDPASAAAMQSTLDSISALYNDSIGFQAAAYVPGQGIWRGAAGSSITDGPLRADMAFRIGSNSKLFCAVTLLKLQEAGLIDLDDHIGKWLQYKPTYIDTSATIRQCLKHETGFFDWIDDNLPGSLYNIYYNQDSVFTSRTILDSLVGPPHWPVGRGYSYSNTNFTIAAMMVEAATGESYWRNLRERVLTPNGLDSTFCTLYDTAIARRVSRSGSYFYGFALDGDYAVGLTSSSKGCGELYSTPGDMVKWYNALSTGQVLTPASMRELMDFDKLTTYGLGIQEQFSNSFGPMYWHGGNLEGFQTNPLYILNSGITIYIAVNTEDNGVSYPPDVVQAIFRHLPRAISDAGVKAIASPVTTQCAASATPVVQIKNYGSGPLTSATITYRIDGGIPVTYSWQGNLAGNGIAYATLPASPVADGEHSLVAYATSANGQDANGTPLNDTARSTFLVSLTPPAGPTFTEGFESDSSLVQIWNPLNQSIQNWAVTSLTSYAGRRSLGRLVNDIAPGLVSYADLPVVRQAAGSTSDLSFRYAHATYPYADDSLQVLVSTDCGQSWSSVFNEGTDVLGGADTAYTSYFPQSAQEWKIATVSLAAYPGDVLVRFRQTSGAGNNIFLDDIQIRPASTTALAALAPSLEIYPNPSSGTVRVRGLAAGSVYSLADLTGKVYFTRTSNGDIQTIEIGSFPTGIYTLHTGQGVRKLVRN